MVTNFPRTWFKARLLAAADNVFTETFYNEPNKQGVHFVWCAEVQVTPSHTKFVVASRKEVNAVRIMSKELGLSCLDPVEVVSAREAAELDTLVHWVRL